MSGNNCSTGSCGTSGMGLSVVLPKARRPTFMTSLKRGLLYPAGSTAFDANDYWYTPVDEDRMPNCGPSNWRRLDMRTIWLKLQRLSDCQADFIFPPILAGTAALACDEAPTAQVWNLNQVGTRDGKLYTPKRNGVLGTSNLLAADWCGGYTSAQVIAWVLKKMCAEDSAANLG